MKNPDSEALVAVAAELVAMAKAALEEHQRDMPYVGGDARRRALEDYGGSLNRWLRSSLNAVADEIESPSRPNRVVCPPPPSPPGFGKRSRR